MISTLSVCFSVGPSSVCNQVISRTAHRYFFEILHEVKWSKYKKNVKAEILKKILDHPLGAKMAHFRPKNQHFPKYLKKVLLDFLVFLA